MLIFTQLLLAFYYSLRLVIYCIHWWVIIVYYMLHTFSSKIALKVMPVYLILLHELYMVFQDVSVVCMLCYYESFSIFMVITWLCK